MQFLSYLINGLGLGSVYAIIALGYTMVYGIAKMLNFAHGDVIMVGSYIAFFALTKFGLPFPLAVLTAILVCTVLGVVIERLAYKPLRQAPSLAVLITAIGVSYFLQNGAQILWSSSSKVFPSVISAGSISIGAASVSYLTLLTIATCIVVMICLTLFINKTKTGSAMRACSEDKGASMLMGINVNQIISITFAIGSGLAAFRSRRFRRRTDPRYHRDLRESLYFDPAFRRDRIRRSDRDPLDQAHRPSRQEDQRQGLRREKT